MKVLVLGGAGFIGANLVRRLLREGCQVTVLDSLDGRLKSTTDNLQEIWSDIRFIHGDIRDKATLDRIIPEFDIIYHCAAQTSHSYSLQEPFFDVEVNCGGTIRVLESIRHFNPDAKAIYVSTTTVIGRAHREVIDEEHVERPTEIYSANKGVAEKYYQIYSNVHGLNTVVLRFPNLFGPYGKPFPEFNFINYFISKVWAGGQIEIFGSGDSVRNVMYIDDATDLLWKILEISSLRGEILFATSPFHHSVREIAEMTVEVLGRGQLKLVPWPEERKVIEVGAQRFSADRLFSHTGWNPKFDLREGLLQVLDFLEAAERGPRKVAR